MQIHQTTIGSYSGEKKPQNFSSSGVKKVSEVIINPFQKLDDLNISSINN
jgi:hypothetical protein